MKTLLWGTVILAMVFLPLSLAAKPKEKVFDAPTGKVYVAVQKAIRDHYVVTYTDDKQMVVSFSVSQTFWVGGFVGSASVEAENGKGKLRLNLQPLKNGNFGKEGRIEDDIIRWVGEELDNRPEN